MRSRIISKLLMWQGLLASMVATALLSGCAGGVPEKRHTPLEIANYQPADFSAAVAAATGRLAAHDDARAMIERATADAGAAGDGGVADALWAVQFLNQSRGSGLLLTLATLPSLPAKEPAQQRAVLSAAHSLYARETASSILALLEQIATPREFAIGAYTVLRGLPGADAKSAVLAIMQTRFPGWPEEPRLIALHHALTTDSGMELAMRPPLSDLLAHPLRPGLPVVFSFQRKDRRHFGLALVRGPDGRFVRHPDGALFNVAQLAMALSNLPGTLTNGNTPQGVFTIVGAGTATNRWIGPTPYLHSKVPVEATVAEFEHAAVEGEWDVARYESFLPASWGNYFPMKEAFLAGRAGRDEMLAHGTTVDPALYVGESWYPGTPSAGCLVAMEYWSAQDGRLLHSDQLSLAKAFTVGGLDRGYLVVVEVDDQRSAVVLAELLPHVLEAEARIFAGKMPASPSIQAP